eukprot:271791_1
MPQYLFNKVLNIIDNNFDLNEDLQIWELIVLHRVVMKINNDECIKQIGYKIHMILENKNIINKIKTNVMSYFVLNNKSYSISTGYDVGGCRFNSHEKVDALMKDIGYKINITECSHLESKYAKELHLKSHSEKKALAILLNEELCSNNEIKIKVSMKMCADCHAFFCVISKKYNVYDIQCIDPKGIHTFKNGVCLLCSN